MSTKTKHLLLRTCLNVQFIYIDLIFIIYLYNEREYLFICPYYAAGKFRSFSVGCHTASRSFQNFLDLSIRWCRGLENTSTDGWRHHLIQSYNLIGPEVYRDPTFAGSAATAINENMTSVACIKNVSQSRSNNFFINESTIV